MEIKNKIIPLLIIVCCLAAIAYLAMDIMRQKFLPMKGAYSQSGLQKATSGDLRISWSWYLKKTDPVWFGVYLASSENRNLNDCKVLFDGGANFHIQASCVGSNASAPICTGIERVTRLVPRFQYDVVEDRDGHGISFDKPHVVKIECAEGFSEWRIDNKDF